MRSRLTFIIGALTALALVAGAAWAAMPASVDSDAIIEVAEAGTVTIAQNGSNLEIAAVSPAAGWSHTVEVRSGREVEVDFRNGSRRVQMNADLEDGEIRVRVRERVQTSSSTSTTVGSDSTSTTVDDTGSPTSTAAGNATSTTVQDSSSTTADDDTTSTTIDDSTSTTMDDSDGPEEAGSESYAVGAAASVTIAWTNGQMTLVSVSVADGWSISDQDLRSDRVEIEFESGDREAEFRADFHHGTVRVETKVG